MTPMTDESSACKFIVEFEVVVAHFLGADLMDPLDPPS